MHWDLLERTASDRREPRFAAQDDASHLRVNVVLVQLNVAVTDTRGTTSAA